MKVKLAWGIVIGVISFALIGLALDAGIEILGILLGGLAVVGILAWAFNTLIEDWYKK